jgi:hypothetical protein
MDLNEISLDDINKSFEYERQARFIDSMDNIDDLKNFAKLYCKLYLKQQEVLSIFEINSI